MGASFYLQKSGLVRAAKFECDPSADLPTAERQNEDLQRDNVLQLQDPAMGNYFNMKPIKDQDHLKAKTRKRQQLGKKASNLLQSKVNVMAKVMSKEADGYVANDSLW